MQTMETRWRLLPAMILMLLASPATAQYAASDDQIDQLLSKITSDSHEKDWRKFDSATGNVFAVPMSSLERLQDGAADAPNNFTFRVSVYEIGPYAGSLDRHIMTFNCHGLVLDWGSHGLVNMTVSPGSVLGAIGRAVCPKPLPPTPRATGLPLAFLAGQQAASTGSTAIEKTFVPDLRGVAVAKLMILNDFDVYLTRGKTALDWSQLSGLDSPGRAEIQRLNVANMVEYFFAGTGDGWSDDAKRILAVAYAWGVSMPPANACEMAYSTNKKPDDACQRAFRSVPEMDVQAVLTELRKHLTLPPQ